VNLYFEKIYIFQGVDQLTIEDASAQVLKGAIIPTLKLSYNYFKFLNKGINYKIVKRVFWDSNKIVGQIFKIFRFEVRGC